MNYPAWIDGFPGAITICDREGTILYINDQGLEVLADDGGMKLIGQNLLDCHPEPSRSKLKMLMDTQQPNVYTIEKKSRKKLIYQSPWYQDGEYAGFVELSLFIPYEMPHFVRQG